MMIAHTGSNPATCPPIGRIAATTAVKTPRIAKDLESIPPCKTSARATKITRGTSIKSRNPALFELLLRKEFFCMRNGQKNANNPINEVISKENFVKYLF